MVQYKTETGAYRVAGSAAARGHKYYFGSDQAVHHVPPCPGVNRGHRMHAKRETVKGLEPKDPSLVVINRKQVIYRGCILAPPNHDIDSTRTSEIDEQIYELTIGHRVGNVF